MADQSTAATLIYTIGEVLISMIVLVGGFVLVYYSREQSAQLVGSGAISAATVFWFQRRQSEQSNNSLRAVADGKLAGLQEAQIATARQQEAFQTLVMSQLVRMAEGAAEARGNTP